MTHYNSSMHECDIWRCSRLYLLNCKVSVQYVCLLHMSVITQDGIFALMGAAGLGKTEVVVELVKTGASVDMQNKVCQYTATLYSRTRRNSPSLTI